MDLNEVLARRLAEIPRVQSVTGTFLSMVDGLARVNLQNSTVDVKCDGWYPPIPGQPVRVDSSNGILRVTGPARTQPGRATVVESLDGGTRARVEADGKSYVLPVMAPYVPIASDVVVVNWTSGHVLGEEAAAPEEVAPPPASSSGPVPFQPFVVQAVDSGKWSTSYSNWYGNSDVHTGVTTQGAWFYGGGFGVLAGANITSVEIYLPLIREQNNVSFGLHGHPFRPGGSPGIGSLVARGTRSGWVFLPDTWGNLLRDNPTWGIGAVSPGGGNNQWVGRGRDEYSGALRFNGSR